MTRRNERGPGFAVGVAILVSGIGILTVGASSSESGRRSLARAADCAVERAALELAESALERELTAEGEGPVGELARARDVAFTNYCDCIGVSAAQIEPRAPVFTPGRRGTPPFASTPGRPVFTPPGPPPGRPPVTLPPTTPRGRRPVTPPGPPPSPPGPPRSPSPTPTP